MLQRFRRVVGANWLKRRSLLGQFQSHKMDEEMEARTGARRGVLPMSEKQTHERKTQSAPNSKQNNGEPASRGQNNAQSSSPFTAETQRTPRTAGGQGAAAPEPKNGHSASLREWEE